MALAKTTQDHDEIRKWAEARGGKPGAIKATEKGDDPGILRLMFPHAPHHNDEAIKEISWEEFFEKFDESGLELTYQEKTADGKMSDFNKLTYPDPDSPQGKNLLAKSAGKKSSAKKSAATKSASKTAAKKAAAKKTSAKKTSAKKSALNESTSKKSAGKSASRGSASSTPARNYPKPEHGGGNSQVF